MSLYACLREYMSVGVSHRRSYFHMCMHVNVWAYVSVHVWVCKHVSIPMRCVTLSVFILLLLILVSSNFSLCLSLSHTPLNWFQLTAKLTLLFLLPLKFRPLYHYHFISYRMEKKLLAYSNWNLQSNIKEWRKTF